MKYNTNAAPIGLHDVVYPSGPYWYDVRTAIQAHREDKRKPVSFVPPFP